MITAAGVGSGIDIESILSQLGDLERQPVNVLNRKRAALDVELSAYGTVKGALSNLKTSAEVLGSTQNFGAFVASSSDEDVFTAEANGGDIAVRHEIEVLSLATNHRLASQAYASESSIVDPGTLRFGSGDNNFDIQIGPTTSLRALRDAINDSLDNTTVSASIVNVDGGSRLILTAKESGTAGAINVSRPNVFPMPDSPSGFSEVSPATDASLIVHGFTVTSSSNSISDVIDGVTLNLKGVGKSVVSTERDTESLRSSLDDFVTKYNAMTDTLNRVGQADLQGDQLPRGIDSRMRNAFFQSIDLGNGDSTSALDMGFTFDRFGKLSISESKYNAALEAGVNRFVSAFSNADNGLADIFTAIVDEYNRAGGIIDNREDGVGTRKSSIDDQIDRLEYRIEKTNARLRRQFTAMDLTVTNLQSTSSFLTSRLSNNDF